MKSFFKNLLSGLLRWMPGPMGVVHAIDGDQTLSGRALIGVEHHTASDTLLARENGTLHTNKGATGTIALTLPAAVAGMHFYFAVLAAFALQIEPASGEVISLPSNGVPEAADDYIVADALRETVHLVCVETGAWAVMGFTGTWTGQ
jgi:hypothetical protein